MERLLDLALAASAASWAILGFLQVDGRPLSVRIALSVLNGAVALLLATRRAPSHRGAVSGVLAALPSMALGGAALRFADGPWPLWAEALFCVGAALATCSLAFLGRSFAFLPSVRGLVDHGPYRFVRHPAYASELIVMLACACARPWPNVLLLVATVFAIHVRIRAEEHLLGVDPAYDAYRSRVRFRMIPGVY